MDNPTRTADYIARSSARQTDLKALLAETLCNKSLLTLEIGCGHGHYLTGYAAQHPARLCIGIDIILDRVARADRKQTRANLPNLTFIRAEASEFLQALPQHVTLDEIFVLFPDPWPKRRHHKNRLIQPAFLSELAGRAGEGAHLYFRTDHAPYLDSAKTNIAAHPNWKLNENAHWPFELTTVFQARAASFASLVATKRSSTPSLTQPHLPPPPPILQ